MLAVKLSVMSTGVKEAAQLTPLPEGISLAAVAVDDAGKYEQQVGQAIEVLQ